MVRDPLYRSIERRLRERLDPDLFERCAVELLREVYPGIVPIGGGGDGGMDGGISSYAGASLPPDEPIPLIVTTAKNVLKNLTDNLDSYRSAVGSARVAVLATSQALTPRKRRNLEERAEKLGFTLRNIHDRTDFTGRLYRNPVWRKDLLGLTGDLPALSALPDKAGSRLTMDLVGREQEMDWLRRASGDVVVVGQPGVGKTALLEALAREGEGLFPVVTRTRSGTAVTSGDMRRIADAYRAQHPPRIFVDDVHLRDSLIASITRLRDEIGAEFSVVATTWPSHKDEVRRELYCPSDRVMSVEGLDRQTAGRIVRQVNAGFSDELIGEILNQSVDNLPDDDPRTPEYPARGRIRPGLAVTLARYSDLGDVTELTTGKLLLREVYRDARLTGSQLDHLAAFALGGSAGMRLAMAAQALDTPATTVRQSLRQVSGTGIVRDLRGGAAAIHPRHLRHALVKRTFFSGASSLPVEPPFDRVEDAVPCTETLIEVAGRSRQAFDRDVRGGSHASLRQLHALIQSRLEKHEDAHVGGRLWESYALTGEDAVHWILDKHSNRTTSIAGTALEHAPDQALGTLVSRALNHPREAGALTESIRAWVLAGQPDGDAVPRRTSLVRELAAQASGGDLGQAGRKTATELLAAAFSLSFQRWRGDPIEVTGFTVNFGSLPAADVRKVAALWSSALPVFRSSGQHGLYFARQVVRGWLTGPGIPNELLETRATAHVEVPRMLAGVLDLARNEPGIVLWARRLARRHGLDAELPDVGDPVLRRLFPDPRWPEDRSDAMRELRERLRRESPHGDWPQERLAASARDFARKWQHGKPQEVVARMLHLERQRKLMDHNYPNVLEHVPLHLAQRVDDPGSWLEELVGRNAPPSWVGPFLKAVIVMSGSASHAWKAIAAKNRYDWLCMEVGLRHPALPREIFDHIMDEIPGFADYLSEQRVWTAVHDEWKRRLLQHHEPKVRAAVAAGLWNWDASRSRPRGELGTLWQDAVVSCGGTELLEDVLRVDGAVALAWLLREARKSSARRKRSNSGPSFLDDDLTPEERRILFEQAWTRPSLNEDLLVAAIDRLDLGDRRELISAIPTDANPTFFRYLVGGNPDLYAVLLRRRAAKDAHLAPLRLARSEEREALLQEAIKHGYSRETLETTN